MFLSAALAVFLLLSIIALVKINQILTHVKRITARADKIADKAEAVGEFFRQTNGVRSIVGTIGNIIHSFHEGKKGGKRSQ